MITPSSSGQCDLASDAKLSLRAFVNPARVPLYLQAGPPLEVHLKDVNTATWLKGKIMGNTLLDPDECDELQTQQCPVALLLGVEESGKRGSQNATGTWQRVTDVLIYGVLSLEPRHSTHPITTSCPPDSHSGGMNVELRTYAVCVCGGRETKVQALPTPPQSPKPVDGNEQGEIAEFLPDMRSPSPKRKRVATLFEAAAEYHKKAQRRGGIAISDFESRRDSPSFTDSPYMMIKRERENASSGIDSGARTGRSRADSMSRSGLSRSITLPNASAAIERPHAKSMGRNIPLIPLGPAPANPATGPLEETASANKALLIRTILTCMRLYGYHRTSRSTLRPTTPAPDFPSLAPDGGTQENPALETDEDDEFKAMYHATYRASTFALRKFLKPLQMGTTQHEASLPVLDKDRAMNAVDSVLKIFCEGQG